MMLYDYNVLDDGSKLRLWLAVAAAACVHLCVLWVLWSPDMQQRLNADVSSAPTQVSVRFTAPQQEAEPTLPPAQEVVKPPPEHQVVREAVKPVIAKPVAKPKAPPPQPREVIMQQNKPHANAPAEVAREDPPAVEPIPVVSGARLKGRRVAPHYPQKAMRRGYEGIVWIRVLISPTGARQDIVLHTPSPYSSLNQAAIKAVKKWTFDPHRVNGQAVQSWVEIPIEFKLQ